jgi:hypothetical protein
MAKDLLLEEYYTKKEHILEEWRELKNKTNSNENIPEIPKLPPYPTELDILRKATILNDFISKNS